MAAIEADTDKDDPGLTVVEWAEKLGHRELWVRTAFAHLKIKNKLLVGRAWRVSLSDRNYRAMVYRLKHSK